MADLNRMTASRIRITKGDTVIANLSLPFTILAVIISPHLALIAALLVAALGYEFKLDRRAQSAAQKAEAASGSEA